MFLCKRKSKHNEIIQEYKTRNTITGNGVLSYHTGSIHNIGSRMVQEDSFALVNVQDDNKREEQGLFAVVADGMGGLRNGKMVSEMAVASLVQLFQELDRERNLPKQLYNGIHQVNHRLYEEFGGNGGTTVVLVMVFKDIAYWASVGSSSVYLKRNGGLFKLNKEHTYRNELYLDELKHGGVNKEGIENHPRKGCLSEYLGSDILGEIDYNLKPLKLKKNDVILICSDGISNSLDTGLINTAVALPPETACGKLTKMIEERAVINQDNYTALIISCV